MKLAIIGGAGARVPLVTNGLLRFHDRIGTSELSLWDIHDDRRRTVAGISRAMTQRFSVPLNVTTPRTFEEAIEGADFVISSIRVGGIAGRVIDETLALEHGVIGQETVGPGGWALALRTIPFVIDYVRQIERLAPDAWILNFTNPVGIVSQALLSQGLGRRFVGVCDTPREQFAHLAESLQLSLEDCFFDYLGLNHLGWVRRIVVDGEDVSADILADDERLDTAFPIDFFGHDFLRELQLFPTEYLYFYYSPRQAFEKTIASGGSRGRLIEDLEETLMADVAKAGDDSEAQLEAYEHYLASRNASYMAVETGGQIGGDRIAAARQKLYQSAAGYERIAIDVMAGIRSNQPIVMPLNVANNGAIADLEPSDAVEVGCVVDANGPHPLAANGLPEQVRPIVQQVKDYERLTAQAAIEGSRELATRALAANPIVENRALAERLVDAFLNGHREFLGYLK